MASAAPTASSTKETTNYARLCRLLVDIGTQALRDVFDSIHASANLHTVLAANKATLQSLRARKIINPIPWGKLFPAIPTSVSSRDFDTTLLMVLLRNLCGLTPPLTGWDALPAVTDLSREADIARVKYYRNTVYGHAKNASVDDIKFNDYWLDIRDTLVRLGGVRYEAAIDDLRNECMDPEVEDHYKELLSQWKKDEDNIKEELGEIKKMLNVLTASKEVTDEGGISANPEESKRGQSICKYHKNKELEYYCLQCKVCICDICGQIRHDHHTKVDIRQAAEERKVPMAKTLYEAKTEIVAVDSKINKQIELRKKSKARIAAAENKVTETVEELVQILREHEKMVKAKLTEIDEKQEQDHVRELEKFQILATKLKCSVEHGEDIFQRDISVEILEEENVVFAPCKELVSQSQKIQVHKPEDVNYVVNTGNVTDLKELVQLRLDQVVVNDHSQSVAEGKGLKGAELGAEATFTVTTRDSDRKQFYSEQEQVTVSISSPTREEETQITDCKDGNYTVHYKPKSVGRHDVTIEINGWPLTGSPWGVDVKPHQYKVVKSCGSHGKKEGEFVVPFSISKNEKSGNIAVADHLNERVQVFDENLKYLRTIGGGTRSQTDAAVKIGRPYSVAFLRNGDMIVIHGDETVSTKMSIICDDGQFIKQFSEHLFHPNSVFVKTDDDGHVIVCDSGDRKIKVLSSDGVELLQSFSAPDYDSPPICAYYHHDMFFVSYYFDHCFKVFNKEGVFLYNIGSEGSGEGQFKQPRGLVVDAFDNLIVCDIENQRLQMFTLDGKFLTSFGQDIRVPWFATVCKNSDLLVIDVAKHSVAVFR